MLYNYVSAHDPSKLGISRHNVITSAHRVSIYTGILMGGRECWFNAVSATEAMFTARTC